MHGPTNPKFKIHLFVLFALLFSENIFSKKNSVPINGDIRNRVVALCVLKIHARIQRVTTDPRPRNLTEMLVFLGGLCDFLRFLYAFASAVL